jgi:hypothetical protein
MSRTESAPQDAPPRTRSALVNVVWAVILLALSISAVMLVVGSARAWLLFYDGDSVLPALMAHDLFAGRAMDWHFSPVLFFPELGVYFAVAVLHLGLHATPIIVGIIWVFLIGTALRLMVRWALPAFGPRAHVSGSLVAMALIVVQIATERSADRASVELASLITNSTYYVSTTFAMLLIVGLVVRTWTEGARIRTLIWIAAVLAAATLVNPIIVAWAVIPACLGLLTLWLTRRATFLPSLLTVVALGVGSGVGMLARVPFSSWIIHTPGRYFRREYAGMSESFFRGKLTERLSGAAGLVDFEITLLGIAAAIAIVIIGFRVRDRGLFGLGAITVWMIPITAVWPIALGSFAPRYWQPIEFLPMSTLAVLVAWLLRRASERRVVAGRRAVPRSFVAVVAVVTVAALALAGATTLHGKRSTADLAAANDVGCVVSWVNAHPEQYGAGVFFAIRPAKVYVNNPAQLIGITNHSQQAHWLANGADFANDGKITFLVRQSADYLTLPSTTGPTPVVQSCGSLWIQQLSHPFPIRQYDGF